MNIKSNSKVLLEKLQYLSGIGVSVSTMPILENFLFEVTGNELKITASDLDNTMIAKLEVESQTDAKVCIPSKMLLDILKLLPSQPIEINKQADNLIEIVSASGNYSVACYDGDQFPKALDLENPAAITIKSESLETAISNTIFACGNNELRPVMNGVLFQVKTNSITFVATDAHRLAKYVRNDVSCNQEVDFIVPKKPLGIIKGILATLDVEVEIKYNQNNASFSFGDYEMKSRLIDAKYPNYEAVIPKNNPNSFMVNTKEFLASLKRVSIFSDKTTHQVAIKQTGEALNIMAEDKNYSTNGTETITCEPNCGEIQIGFNARFLSEALGNVPTEKAIIETSAPNRAGIVKPEFCLNDEEYLMLVMPVMLNS
jgi:DNA polymerase-3 subunit beta